MAAAERGEPRGALSASLPPRSTYRRSGRPWAWRAWTQGGSGRQRRAPKRRRAGRGLASRAHRALRSPESTRFSKWRFGQESGNAAANQGHELELARAGGGNGMEEAGRGGSGAFAGNPGSKTGRGSPGVAPQLTEGRARGRLSPAHGAWRGGKRAPGRRWTEERQGACVGIVSTARSRERGGAVTDLGGCARLLVKKFTNLGVAVRTTVFHRNGEEVRIDRSHVGPRVHAGDDSRF